MVSDVEVNFRQNATTPCKHVSFRFLQIKIQKEFHSEILTVLSGLIYAYTKTNM